MRTIKGHVMRVEGASVPGDHVASEVEPCPHERPMCSGLSAGSRCPNPHSPTEGKSEHTPSTPQLGPRSRKTGTLSTKSPTLPPGLWMLESKEFFSQT